MDSIYTEISFKKNMLGKQQQECQAKKENKWFLTDVGLTNTCQLETTTDHHIS